ncbi:MULTISPECIES: phage N-6-adenine-methyltransferase [unclassified Aeromonas]|uniref:phage N-6-adenine-methyltransferase n=1 Tax=unclassified Aeromonas TaxID=257493 RepID=UPI0022E4851E|nr:MULTISPECIES: phage N-6-adenine-methyltransferase [unclassified Aeromonas]
MNHYAQALAELQAQPDNELKQIGDQWQTPKALAWGLFHKFAPTLGPVVLDMFADDCNHLVPHYYDAEDNALTQELAADLRRLGGAAYANPPYSRPCTDSEGNPITGMEAILNYCREQRALGAKIMLLIKAATSETWWPEDADFIQFISGRIGFEVPSWYVPRDPKKDKPSSSGFASAVVIFDASWQGERRPEARLRRDDLITTGTIILDMIHRQAVELTLAADHVIRNATPKLTPVVTQEQPAETEPAAGEPPAADDNEASAAAAAELGYADASSIMAKQIECVDLGEEQQDTVRGYVQGWLDEPYPLSEIFYRLDLAVANLLAGKPIHQGFVAEECRSPALPHWQRHPAVKGVIYQIDDADILTPAKTAELAAWIIDNLTAPGDLLTLATAKAAELLAQSAEPTSPEPDHAEQQLDMVDVPGQEPDAHQVAEEFSTKPLEDWAFDYQNDQLNLGGAEWSCFVAVLTVLYGIKETYSAREVAIAISVSDEQLMDEYTTLDEETKEQLRQCVAILALVERQAPAITDSQRQAGVAALLQAIEDNPKIRRLDRQRILINAITQQDEVAA